jgi:hypothetical protein
MKTAYAFSCDQCESYSKLSLHKSIIFSRALYFKIRLTLVTTVRRFIYPFSHTHIPVYNHKEPTPLGFFTDNHMSDLHMHFAKNGKGVRV